MTMHFEFRPGEVWRDIMTLCLKSCKRNSGAARIVVHYAEPGAGKDWDEAQALGNIEWRKIKQPAGLLYRLSVLWIEGGFFCDLDFVFLRSLEQFRDARALIGTQCKQKQKLAVNMLASVPGGTFIKAFADALEQDDGRTPQAIAWDLSTRHDLVILPRPVFYPVAHSNKAFWSGAATCFKNASAVSLWGSLRPNLTVQDLRLTDLRVWVEAIADDRPQLLAQILPGTTLYWD